MKTIKNWEIWGAVVTIIIGSLLHFTFAWSGNNHFVALFAAVNESTWEHLKLAFWPAFIFSVIEWLAWGLKYRNFCFASFIKLVSMPILIIALFYGWLLFFSDSLIWDIFIFVFAIIVGYWLSYLILRSKKFFGSAIIWSPLIAGCLAAFITFTYKPPINFLFKDPINGHYGIPVKNMDDPNGCLNYSISDCPEDFCHKSCEPSVGLEVSDCLVGKCVPNLNN